MASVAAGGTAHQRYVTQCDMSPEEARPGGRAGEEHAGCGKVDYGS